MAERKPETMVAWLDINLENLTSEDKTKLVGELFDTLGALELRQLRDLAEEKRKEKLEDAKTEVLLEMREKFEQLGLNLEDIFPSNKRKAKATGVTLSPKYRSPNGENWSGRGNSPNWLKQAEAQGHKREEFLVQSE